MAYSSSRKSKTPSPLTPEKLRDLALWYVGRYAVSEVKLARYLGRKIFERGWDGERPADPVALAQEFARLGYVDDVALAEAKARASVRKGQGVRRLSQDLHAVGIAEKDSVDAVEEAHGQAWQAADNFARKRRIGPYADTQAEEDKQRKQLAAYMRAGHSFDIARKFVTALPDQWPEENL